MGKESRQRPSRPKEAKALLKHKIRSRPDLDGLQKMTCMRGITEWDLDNYFQKIRDTSGAFADRDVHAKAMELVRSLPTRVRLNCELVVLGDVTAVYFLSGKGRKRLCVQPDRAKVAVKVHIENLALGFLRFPVGAASLLECVCAALSAVFSLNASDVEEADGLVNICILMGNVVRAVVGFLAAMDTISALPSLFSPLDSHNSIHTSGAPTQAPDPVGLGLVKPGRQRWLHRALAYLLLASRADLTRPLHFAAESLDAAKHSLWIGLDISRVTLMVAALLSLIFHCISVRFPSVFKTPWASVQRCSPYLRSNENSSKLVSEHDEMTEVKVETTETTSVANTRLTWEARTQTVKQDKKTDNVEVRETLITSTIKVSGSATKGSLSVLEMEEGSKTTNKRNEGGAQNSHCMKCRGCARMCTQRCSLLLALTLTSLAALLVTSLLVCVCQVTRLTQSPLHLPNRLTELADADWVLSCVAAILLAAVVMASSGMSFAQKLCAGCCCCQRDLAPMPTLMVALAACVSSVLSRDVVTWLAENDWRMEQIGKTLFAGLLTVLLLPTALVACTQLPRMWASPSCTLAAMLFRALRSCVSLKHIQQGLFMLSVLLGICGAVLAIWALPLPMAHVQTRFNDKMNAGLNSIVAVQNNIRAFMRRLDDFSYAFACGEKDIESKKKDIDTARVKALDLTIPQLRENCDDKDPDVTLYTLDKFCVNYTAAKLYFSGSIHFNGTFHEQKIRSYKKSGEEEDEEKEEENEKERQAYLNDVINRARGKALEDMKIGDIKVDKTSSVKQICKDALEGICIAKHIAFVALLIPFFGALAAPAYAAIQIAEYIVRFLIDLSSVLPLVKQFHRFLGYIHVKLLEFEKDRLLQFSINNFNLIYVAYPAIISGCVVVLLGFWHRRGTYPSRQFRAALGIMVPLLLINLMGLVAVFLWIHLVQLLAESVPLMTVTVTELSALVLLRAAYVLSVSSCVVIIMLAGVAHARYKRQQWAERKAQVEIQEEKRETPTSSTSAKKSTPDRKITVTRETESRGTAWLLAWLLTMGAVASVTMIHWNPVFVFKFQLSHDLEQVISQINQSSYGVQPFQKMVSNSDSICDLGSFFAKAYFEKFLAKVKQLDGPLDTFLERFKEIADELKAETPSPTLMHFQMPIMICIYIPAMVITWAFVVTALGKPTWGPSRRACRRLSDTMAWLGLGWITGGAWFLTSLGQSGVISAYHIELHTSSGLGYALAACVGLIVANLELRLGGISPLL